VYIFSTNNARSFCNSDKSFVVNHRPKPSNAQETADGRFTGSYVTTFLFKVPFLWTSNQYDNTMYQYPMEREIQNKKPATY